MGCAGLTAAMYLPAGCTDAGGEVGSPDGEAGLHVRSHAGAVVRVTARKDQLLFQVGQSLQVRAVYCWKVHLACPDTADRRREIDAAFAPSVHTSEGDSARLRAELWMLICGRWRAGAVCWAVQSHGALCQSPQEPHGRVTVHICCLLSAQF